MLQNPHIRNQNPSKNFLRILQMHGSNANEISALKYQQILKRILPANIELNVHFIEQTDVDNQNLIDEIFNDLAR